jgi:hypothetical protein
LIVSTQGRAFWILDNISALHQLAPGASTTTVQMFKARDGYRTRVSPTVLGPMVQYYLPSGSSGPVIIDILDEKGAVINSYNSDTDPPARGGRGGGGEPEDPDAAPARRFMPPPRVTKNAGLNRFVWDVRNQAGPTVPPGRYQARLKVGETTFTENFNVLIDPRVAADGVTLADLQEQYEHNMRMRELVNGVNQLVTRVRAAQNKFRTSGGSNGSAAELDAVAGKLLTEPVRYGKPGLQAHITYLAGMTANTDQKIGRDAIERYQVLLKEYEALKAEVDRVLAKP